VSPLGLIAGGGGLPLALAKHCLETGRGVFVIRIKGAAESDLTAFPGVELGLGELGSAFHALHGAGCDAVCLAGTVSRPRFSDLRPDARGVAALPGALRAAARGDDALLTFLLGEFEREGFAVEGADSVFGELMLPVGVLGLHKPRDEDRADIERALEAARAIGALDIGQGAVACRGLVLALEAQEGTDAMLSRVATLPEAVRGTDRRPMGVLAKACKPKQDRRVDLPSLGPATVRGALAAHLAGIVAEAGAALVLDLAETVRLADESGLFIVGVDPLAVSGADRAEV